MAQTQTLVDENWEYLLSLLPWDWEAMAKQTGAVQRLRGAKSVGDLLRVLLLVNARGELTQFRSLGIDPPLMVLGLGYLVFGRGVGFAGTGSAMDPGKRPVRRFSFMR